MEKFKKVIEEINFMEDFVQATLSGIRKKVDAPYKKVIVKPVELKGQILFQFEYHTENKVVHENLEENKAVEKIMFLMESYYKQGFIYTSQNDIQVLVNKDKKASILKKKPSKERKSISHNRKKEYILEDGKKIDFLIELGIMTSEGRVIKSKYDKFRQLNRYLEFIDDSFKNLKEEGTLNIIDFGCGKAYLTFAMYYYLRVIKNRDVKIVGLDLKKDVIVFCNETAKKLGYDGLEFLIGNIVDYNATSEIDMIVTLHACNNATDEALTKGIAWKCDVILSVPCCQHEFYPIIKNESLEPMLKHGLVKERMAALITDSTRGLVLEMYGYGVQMVEFIDMEHTPKNILIRAYKQKEEFIKSKEQEYISFKDTFSLGKIYIDEALKRNVNKNESIK